MIKVLLDVCEPLGGDDFDGDSDEEYLRNKKMVCIFHFKLVLLQFQRGVARLHIEIETLYCSILLV